MVLFAVKVRRHIRGNFTFVIATDREDLDDQILRTFVGCGTADEKTPRARSGRELKEFNPRHFTFRIVSLKSLDLFAPRRCSTLRIERMAPAHASAPHAGSDWAYQALSGPGIWVKIGGIGSPGAVENSRTGVQIIVPKIVSPFGKAVCLIEHC